MPVTSEKASKVEMATRSKEEESRLAEESASKGKKKRKNNRDLSDADEGKEKKRRARNQRKGEESEKSAAAAQKADAEAPVAGEDKEDTVGAEETKATEDYKQVPPPPNEQQQQAAAIAAALGNPLLAAGMPLAAMASPQANFNPFLFAQQGQFPFGFPMQNLQGFAANRPAVGSDQQQEGEQPQEQQQSLQEGQDAQGQEEGNGQAVPAPFNAALLQQLYNQPSMDAAQMMMMGFGNPFMSALRSGMPLANLGTNLFSRSPAIPLSLPCDDEHLSEYQIVVRQQLELFEAQQEDVDSNTQGRKKGVVLGQVGLRCRHCAGIPIRQRGKGSVYYPTKLSGIYQSAQNMASTHLADACQCIEEHLKTTLVTLRQRRDTASGGKMYWADGAKALGLYETEDGLRLSRQPVQPQTFAPS